MVVSPTWSVRVGERSTTQLRAPCIVSHLPFTPPPLPILDHVHIMLCSQSHDLHMFGYIVCTRIHRLRLESAATRCPIYRYRCVFVVPCVCSHVSHRLCSLTICCTCDCSMISVVFSHVKFSSHVCGGSCGLGVHFGLGGVCVVHHDGVIITCD